MDLAALDINPVEQPGLWVPKAAFAQLILACDKGFVECDLFGGHVEVLCTEDGEAFAQDDFNL
jgi:hypothetical protein